MFRPEKMSFINISVLDTNITQVLDCVAKLGIMHIVDKKDLPSTSGLLKDLDIQPTKDKLYDLNNRLNLILDNLEIDIQYLPPIDSKDQSQIEINPFQILDKAQKSIENIESEVKPVVHQIEQLQAMMKELEKDSEAINLLETQGVNLQDLINTRFLYFAFGEIPVGYDHYRRLVESLERINAIVLLDETVGSKQRIMAFGLMSDEDIITNALEGAYFTKTDIPEKYQGAIPEILDNIELEIWTGREEIAEFKLKLRELRQEWQNELLKLRATIFANQTVVESMERFGRTERTYFLSGWVPYKEVKKLKTELEKMDAHGVLMNATEPIKIHEADDYRPKVPTKLTHPFFLKPFSWLTATFDIPGYSAIDPTFFAALSFLAMFGIMFADVGHGGILLLLGLVGCFVAFACA
jgi:V/A-type H+-transporting ATPase subunit I